MTQKHIVNDTKKFWLACFLCVAGVVLLFVALFIPPAGVLSTSVLTGSGELLLTGGAILGVDVAYSIKLKELLSDYLNKPEEKKEEKQDQQ